MFNLYSLKHLLRIGKHTPINDGLIIEKQRKTDNIFGADIATKKVINPSGDWTAFMPTPERQSGRNLETMGCVSFSLLNCIEMMFKAKYGIDVNYSDRYLVKMSNTSPSGNSMSNVIDTARKIAGLVNQDLWPNNIENSDWKEFNKSIPREVIIEGQKWIPDHKLTFTVVPQNRTIMDKAQEYSPLWVCGYAWYKENGLYRSYGRANHCFVRMKKSQENYQLALDQYPEFLKKLANDYLFGAIYNIDVEMLKKKALDFYKDTNGSYYDTNGKKILTLDELAQYVKNGGKEIKNPKIK